MIPNEKEMRRTLVTDADELIGVIEREFGHLFKDHYSGWFLPTTSKPILVKGQHYKYCLMSELMGKKDLTATEDGRHVLSVVDIPLDEFQYPNLKTIDFSEGSVGIFTQSNQFVLMLKSQEHANILTAKSSGIQGALELAEAMIADSITHISKESKFSKRILDFHKCFDYEKAKSVLTAVNPENSKLKDSAIEEWITNLITRLFEIHDGYFLTLINFVQAGFQNSQYDLKRIGTMFVITEGPPPSEEKWQLWKDSGILEEVIEFADQLLVKKQLESNSN